MYMAMEVEKLKVKYITLKEKLQIKTQEANQAENEYNEVAQKLQKAKLEATELREEIETLSEQKLTIDEREQSLRKLLTDSEYNTEALRHTQTHKDARKEYENERRQFLKQELQRLRDEQKRLDDMCEQMTNESNTTEEQLFTEEEKIKEKFRHMRELENALHEIVEKGRLLQSREELELDQQDDMDERIYEMKRLLQQAEVRAERYEILIAELETILGKLEGNCEDVKEEYHHSKKRLEDLLDEIISF